MLEDGLRPPIYLLGNALCVAALKGMGLLCDALIALGAPTDTSWPNQASLHSDHTSWGNAGYEERFAPGTLALMGGDVPLSKRLVERHGSSILGSRGVGALACLRLSNSPNGRLDAKNKAEALSMILGFMDPKKRAQAANLLCIAGRVDEALLVLEHAEMLEKPQVAKAMVAPLCAYPPSDPSYEVALIGLEQALELSEHLGQALAVWSPPDLARMSAMSFRDKPDNIRAETIQKVAQNHWIWPSSQVERNLSCWPRVAASMVGNHEAMAMMSKFPVSKEESLSIKRASQTLIDVLDGKLEAESLPTLWPNASRTKTAPGLLGGATPKLSSPEGHDPRLCARAALAFSESSEIEAMVKVCMKKASKMRKRTGEPEPPQEPSVAKARKRL